MKIDRSVALLPAAVLAVGLLTSCEGDSTPSQQGAAVMCEEFVKKELNSPGTAEFSGVTETKIKTLNDEKPWKFEVTAWVDSQNAFGGVVRDPYVCTIATKDNDTWTLKDLTFTKRR